MVAGLAAFGGGTLRDLPLDRRPFFWVTHAGWLWALLVMCVLAMMFMRARHFEPTRRAMVTAFGLVVYQWRLKSTTSTPDVTRSRNWVDAFPASGMTTTKGSC